MTLLQERSDRWLAAYVGVMVVMILAGGSILGLAPQMSILGRLPIVHKAGVVSMALGVALALALVVWWAVRHRLNKGLKYAMTHARLLSQVRRALLDAGSTYGIERYSGQEKVIVLPKISIELANDLRTGTIRIRNHLCIQKKLEAVDLSSALGRYSVEEVYTMNDGNATVYEIEDVSVDHRITFHSAEELVQCAREHGDYMLTLDDRTTVPLSSMLLVGQTGSGKSYGTYSMIFQALGWENKARVYIADPKNSSLVVLGDEIDLRYSAGTMDRIIQLLKIFSRVMNKRQEELKEKLHGKLDADYRDFGLQPQIFIIDEFASFVSVLNTMDKPTRDEVNSILRSIVLMGRQLGCFLWVLMQKSDSTDIPTAIRNNLPLKICLGQAENTTLMTIFERAADLPKRKFGPGQGLYFCSGLTREPQAISLPTLDFDILAGVRSLCSNGTPVM